MKGVTSGIVKEGDILIIEGGVAKHIINPKKRGEKVTGAYATVFNENLLPSTVFVDVKDISEEDIASIEDIARQRVTKSLKTDVEAQNSAKPSNVRSINERKKNNASSSQNSTNITKTIAEVISVAAPQFEGETQVVVANVRGPKGKYTIMATGKHAERLIVLEGQKACLEMTTVYNNKYKAYEAAEVHFSSKRAVVETEIFERGGQYYAKGKEEKEANIVAHDLKTMKLLEKNVGKKVKLTLEHMEKSQGEFIVTDVVSLEKADEADKPEEEKVS